MAPAKLFTATLITALFCSTSLYAAQAQVTPNTIQMVTGGVSDAGMDDITAEQNHYSLKLIFAENTGAYLADVDVLIRDHKENVIVNTDAQGPVMLIKLKPGTYTVVSKVLGETKTQRIVVHGKGLNTYYIHLNSTES